MNIDDYKKDFEIIINLDKTPENLEVPQGMIEEIMKVIDKYQLLDSLNFLEIFRAKTKGVDA